MKRVLVFLWLLLRWPLAFVSFVGGCWLLGFLTIRNYVTAEDAGRHLGFMLAGAATFYTAAILFFAVKDLCLKLAQCVREQWRRADDLTQKCDSDKR